MEKYVLKQARLETLGVTADVAIDGGRIAGIGEYGSEFGRVFDLQGAALLPGFIDQHTHGSMNVDVNNAPLSHLRRLRRAYARFGVTTVLPTVLSDSPERTVACLSRVAQAAEGAEGAKIAGIHLEGPFLSREYKGAMPEQYLRDPDMDLFTQYQKAARGLIRLVTIAPELPRACDFTHRVSSLGVRVSLGHSGASYEQTVACIRSGAVCATHTFNGMQPLHHHAPGILAAALESDIYCEMICDGRHLSPAIVRLLLKAKGSGKIIAVTDSIMAAGMPDGKYTLGANEVVITDGDAWLSDGSSRAGSTLTMISAFRRLMAYTGCSAAQASEMLSANPAKMLGLWDQTGSISVGKRADLVILDEDLHLHCTIVDGRFAYGHPEGGASTCR